MNVLLLAVLAAPLPARPAAPAFHAVPWGLIDGPFKVAYIRNDKGVEAVEIASGKTLWKAEANEHPLALGGGLLLAWAGEKGRENALRLLALDAATGKEKWKTDAAGLPDWVVAEGPRWGRRFQVAAAVQGGSLFVSWRANAWYAKGRAPTRAEEKAAFKQAEGVLKVPLAGGKPEPLAADKMPPLPGRARGAFKTQIDGRRLLLKREGKPDVELASGGCVHAMSLDGTHVVVLTGFEKPGDPLTGKVLDGAAAREIGSFKCEPPVISLESAGTHVFVLRQPMEKVRGFRTHYGRTLEAIDWKSGKATWSRKGETRVELPLPK